MVVAMVDTRIASNSTFSLRRYSVASESNVSRTAPASSNDVASAARWVDAHVIEAGETCYFALARSTAFAELALGRVRKDGANSAVLIRSFFS